VIDVTCVSEEVSVSIRLPPRLTFVAVQLRSLKATFG
jgi:hypothetical protein